MSYLNIREAITDRALKPIKALERGILNLRFHSNLVLYALSALALARIFIIVKYQVPAPIWDSAFFLGPSLNYCRSGFLGSVIYAVDPLGMDRLVWHGFLSSLLYGSLSRSCSIESFYMIHTIVILLCSLLSFYLAKTSSLTTYTSALIAFYVLAITAQLQFRPEPVGLMLVFCAEIALVKIAPSVFGAASGFLLFTQPNLFGLYGLYLVACRNIFSKQIIVYGSFGFALSAVACIFLYPFPVLDLLSGIARHAEVLAARPNENGLSVFLSLFVRPTFLPLWIVPVGLSFLAIMHRAPVLSLPLALAMYWLSFRNFLNYYNVLAISPLILISALSATALPAFARLVSAFVAIGLLFGLSAGVLRGVQAVVDNPESRLSTLRLIEQDLRDPSVSIRRVPHFYPLLRPDLEYIRDRVNGLRLKATNGPENKDHLSTFQESMRCASHGRVEMQPLYSFQLFQSPGNWSVCRVDTQNP